MRETEKSAAHSRFENDGGKPGGIFFFFFFIFKILVYSGTQTICLILTN